MKWLHILSADWKVNSGISRITITAFRLRQFRDQSGVVFRFILIPVDIMAWSWLTLIIGSDLPARVSAKKGLRLPHGGRGLMVHPSCSIGENVTLYHHVTLGMRNGIESGPKLGNNVYIGCHATLLGSICIGNGAQIGAGAVVLDDVPDNGRAIASKAVISTIQLNRLRDLGNPNSSED